MPPSKPPRIATAGAGGEDDGDPLRADRQEEDKEVGNDGPVDTVALSTDRERFAELFPLHAGYPVAPTLDVLQARIAVLRSIEESEELSVEERQRVAQDLALCLAQIDVLQRAQSLMAPPMTNDVASSGIVQAASGGGGGNMPGGNTPQEKESPQHPDSTDEEEEQSS